MEQKIVVLYGEKEVVACPYCAITGKLPQINGHKVCVLTCRKCKMKFVLQMNQRGHYRKKCTTTDGCIIDHSSLQTIQIAVMDISRTGMQFTVSSGKNFLKIGREYVAQLTVGKKEVSVDVRITREFPGGYGARFFFSQEYSSEEAAIVSFLM